MNWRCRECGHGADGITWLSAQHPFVADRVTFYCPSCQCADCIELVCQVRGCDATVPFRTENKLGALDLCEHHYRERHTRHDRPYSCAVAGCDKIAEYNCVDSSIAEGFTALCKGHFEEAYPNPAP